MHAVVSKSFMPLVCIYIIYVVYIRPSCIVSPYHVEHNCMYIMYLRTRFIAELCTWNSVLMICIVLYMYTIICCDTQSACNNFSSQNIILGNVLRYMLVICTISVMRYYNISMWLNITGSGDSTEKCSVVRANK